MSQVRAEMMNGQQRTPILSFSKSSDKREIFRLQWSGKALSQVHVVTECQPAVKCALVRGKRITMEIGFF